MSHSCRTCLFPHTIRTIQHGFQYRCIHVVSNYISGREVESISKREAERIWNPSTGTWLASTPDSDVKECVSAVASASEAFLKWRETPITHRVRILFSLRECVNREMDTIAGCIAEQLGKTKADARGDVMRGLEVLEYATSIISQLHGKVNWSVTSGGMDIQQVREPLGVCLGLTPFNFPAMLPLWMFPLAIGCGNTFVLKPSPRVPGAAMILANLACEAGVPPGVLNIVHGGQSVSEALIDNPHVQAVSFVGSTGVGTAVYHRATSRGIRAQCNLGAKNHACVMPDIEDYATVAKQLVGAAFGASGQRCMAISVVVLVDNQRSGHRFADVMMGHLVDEARKLRVAPPEDPLADMGPMVTAAAKDRVIQSITTAEEQGAIIALDGRRGPAQTSSPGVRLNPNGFWLAPTIIDSVDTKMKVYQEEVFGPVLVCLRVASLAEAILVINQNPFGNGCAIYTHSGAVASEFAQKIHVGQIGVNLPIPVPLASYGFTGSKASMLGDLHFYGDAGIQFFTRPKTVLSRWPTVNKEREHSQPESATSMPLFAPGARRPNG